MLRAIFILIVAPLVLSACAQKKEQPAQAVVPSANEYPEIALRLNSGEEISARDLRGKNVFVLFQPDCDHCQQEAVQIEQRLEDFRDYTLYFISSAPMEQIMAFADSFHLDQKKNVKFAWTTTEGVLNHYGAIQTPSIYIYTDGKLKESFNGQTDIDIIVAAL